MKTLLAQLRLVVRCTGSSAGGAGAVARLAGQAGPGATASAVLVPLAHTVCVRHVRGRGNTCCACCRTAPRA